MGRVYARRRAQGTGGGVRCRPRHLGGQGSRQSGQEGSGCGNCDAGLPVQGAHIATLSHPAPGHTYLQQHAENVYQPMMSSSAEAAATAAMVPRVVGGWLRASAAGSEVRSPLGVRCWAHCRSRGGRALSIRPPPKCACALGGGSVRRGGRGRSSFVRRGKKIIHLFFPHRPPPPEFILAPFQKIPSCPRLNFIM